MILGATLSMSSEPKTLHLLEMPAALLLGAFLPAGSLAGPKKLTNLGSLITFRKGLDERRILLRIVARSFLSGPHFPPASRERPLGEICR